MVLFAWRFVLFALVYGGRTFSAPQRAGAKPTAAPAVTLKSPVSLPKSSVASLSSSSSPPSSVAPLPPLKYTVSDKNSCQPMNGLPPTASKPIQFACDVNTTEVQLEYSVDPGFVVVNGADKGVIKSTKITFDQPPSSKAKAVSVFVCPKDMSVVELGKCRAYKFEFTKVASSTGPKLAPAGLILSNLPDSSAFNFSPNVFAYNLSLPASSPLTVVAKAKEDTYSVVFDEPPGVGLAPGPIQSYQIMVPEKPGQTKVVKVFVSGPSSVQPTVYTLSVTAVASFQPQVSAIIASPGQMTPAFKSDIYGYMLEVPPATSQVAMKLAPAHTKDMLCVAQSSSKLVQAKFERSLSDLLLAHKKGKPFSLASIDIPLYPVSSSKSALVPVAFHAQPFVNYITYCFPEDAPERFTRYTFKFRPQFGKDTEICGAKIPSFTLVSTSVNDTTPSGTGLFVFKETGAGSGPHIGQSSVPSGWVALDLMFQDVKLDFSKVKVEINGHLVSADQLNRTYFHVPAGEKRVLRLRVIPANPHESPQQYDIVVDRQDQFASKSLLRRGFVNLGSFAAVVSSQAATSFIQTAQFFQMLATTSQLHNAPEAYQVLTKELAPYAFQSSCPAVDSEGPFTVSKPPPPKSDVPVKTSHLRKLQAVSAPSGLMDSILHRVQPSYADGQRAAAAYYQSKTKAVAYTASIFYIALLYVATAVVYTILWHLYISQSSVFSTSKGFKNSAENPSMSRSSALIPSASNKASYMAGPQLAPYQPKLVLLGKSFNLPFVFKSVRRDIPPCLHPARFWSTFYELTFIPTVSMTTGLLFLDSEFRNQSVTLFHFTLTAHIMSFVGLIILLGGPLFFYVVGSCLILENCGDDIVYTSLYRRYHDKTVRYLKSVYRRYPSVPILSSYFTTEVDCAAYISHAPPANYTLQAQYHNRYSQSSSKYTKLSFASALDSQADSQLPWFMSYLAKPKLGEGVHKSTTQTSYPDYGDSDNTSTLNLLNQLDNIEYLNVRPSTREIQLHIEPAIPPKGSDQHTLSTYEKYAEGVIGHSYLAMRDIYGHSRSVKAPVCLSHLPAIFQLKLFSVWAPFECLQQRPAHAWEMLLNKAPKNFVNYWIFDHYVVIMSCLLMSISSSPTNDLIVLTGWLGLACHTLYMTWRPIVATAALKWLSAMTPLSSEAYDYKKNTPAMSQFQHVDVWPFNELLSMAKFDFLLSQAQHRSLASLFARYVASPIHQLYTHWLWSTRFWFTVKEFALSTRFEILRFALTSLLLLSYFVESSSITAMLMLCCTLPIFTLNKDLLAQGLATCLRLAQDVWDLIFVGSLLAVEAATNATSRAQMLEAFTAFCSAEANAIHTVYLKPILSHDTAGYDSVATSDQPQDTSSAPSVSSGPSPITQKHVFKFSVRNASILNQNMGLVMSGTVETCDMQSPRRQPLTKMFHCLVPLHEQFEFFYKSMPIDMPFSTFIASEKRKMIPSVGCCVGTVQAVNAQMANFFHQSPQSKLIHALFPYSRSLQSVEKRSFDAFLSLYTSTQLVPDMAVVYVKKSGHGYTVRYSSLGTSVPVITIRGPELKADHEYCISSSSPAHSLSGAAPVDAPDKVSYTASCNSSGYLLISIQQHQRPSPHQPITVTNAHFKAEFSIHPEENLVRYQEYKVGSTLRQEVILRSRFFKRSTHPYTVSWTAAPPRGTPINATVFCSVDGTVEIPWTSAAAEPDLTSIIVIQDLTTFHSTQNSPDIADVAIPEMTSIVVDPLETDAHQFYFKPSTSADKPLVAQAKQWAESAVLGIQSYAPELYPLEPVPCTIVQCVNPYTTEYRVEPNFKAALLAVQSRIEELEAILQYDFTDGILSSVVSQWYKFVSIQEAIEFWDQVKIRFDNVDGALYWVDPMSLLESSHSAQYGMEYITSQIEFFCHLVSDRVKELLDHLKAVKEVYEKWHRAYADPSLYAKLLKRDWEEWKVKPNELKTASELLQQAKSPYNQLIKDFQYPLTLGQRYLSFKSTSEAQTRLWRETLVAWLAQTFNCFVSEAYLKQHYLNPCLCESSETLAFEKPAILARDIAVADVVVEDIIRALEQSVQTNLTFAQMRQNKPYDRPVVHYVTPKDLLVAKPPVLVPEIPTHYAMVRLYPGQFNDDQQVDWTEPIWAPCFLKLTQEKLNIFIPAENVLTPFQPYVMNNYTDTDVFKRFPWTQIQAYSIPTPCLEHLSASDDVSPPQLSKLSDARLYKDFSEMTTKLVFYKRFAHVDSNYVQSVYGNCFSNDVILNGKVYKLMLCNTVHSQDRQLYDMDDVRHHGVETNVCPLTFRLCGKYSQLWQETIQHLSQIPLNLKFSAKNVKLLVRKEPFSETGARGAGRFEDRLTFVTAKALVPQQAQDPSEFYKRFYDDDAAYLFNTMTNVDDDFDKSHSLQKRLAQRILYIDQKDDYHLEQSDNYEMLTRELHQKMELATRDDPRMSSMQYSSETITERQGHDAEMASHQQYRDGLHAKAQQQQQQEDFDSGVLSEKSGYSKQGQDRVTSKFAGFFAGAKTKLKQASETQVVALRGDFERAKILGKKGVLHDKQTGDVLLSGSWIDNEQCGRGVQTFTDYNNAMWRYEGSFAADNFVEGQLGLVDQAAYDTYQSALGAHPKRFALLSYAGKFYVPSVAIHEYEEEILRKLSYSDTRSATVHPSIKEALANGNVTRSKKEEDIIYPITRSTSAGADAATLQGSIQLAEELYRLEYESNIAKAKADPSSDWVLVDKQGVKLKVPKEAAKSIEPGPYMEHYSKWQNMQAFQRKGIEMVQETIAVGRATFVDGTMYHGEFRHGIPHGVGLLYDPVSNTTIHGHFKNGIPSGYCTIHEGFPADSKEVQSTASSQYFGEVVDSKPNGEGALVAANRDVVIYGTFKDGKLAGPECFVQLSDQFANTHNGYKTYFGAMQNNEFHSEGTLTWMDGQVFKGTFENGQKKVGELLNAQGKVVYMGQYQNDVPHGQGMICGDDGFTYTGELFQGKRQGIGELTYKNNLVYEGMWYDNLPNGHGTSHCADGIYDGEFKNGKRHGKGRFVVKDSVNGTTLTYDGNWKDDMPHGIGTYTDNTGLTMTVKFINGKVDPASVNAYKPGMCGKSQAFDEPFKVKPGVLPTTSSPVSSEANSIPPLMQHELHSFFIEKVNSYYTRDTDFLYPQKFEIEHREFDQFCTEHPYADLAPVPDPRQLDVTHKEFLQRHMQSSTSAQEGTTSLYVFVKGAEGLPSTSTTRKLHPYCRLHVGHSMKRTKPINSAGSNPNWMSTFNFANAAGWCEVEVWDKQPLGADTCVASGNFSLKDLKLNELSEIQVDLRSALSPGNAPAGKVFMKLCRYDSPDAVVGLDTSISSPVASPVADSSKLYNLTIQTLNVPDLELQSLVYFILTLEDQTVKSEVFSVTAMPFNLKSVLSMAVPSESDSLGYKLEVWRQATKGPATLLGHAYSTFTTTDAKDIALYKYDPSTKLDVQTGTVTLTLHPSNQ